jgi:hypothetical protein
LLSIIYLSYLNSMCLSLYFFFKKNILFHTKKYHALYCHIIKWKIIFGTKKLLDLMTSKTYVASILGRLEFTLFFNLMLVFFTDFALQLWVNLESRSLIYFFQDYPCEFHVLTRINPYGLNFFHPSISSKYHSTHG